MCVGILGFVFYFIYDINSIYWNNRWLQKLFIAGTGLITLSTAGVLYNQRANFQFGSALIIGGAAVMLFFLLLIYTLFFSLPFKETYLEENTERKAYTQGMYGLCRHPGVLWFAGVYAGLTFMTGSREVGILSVVLTALNILYIIFQDLWTFPKTFSDYGEYKKSTPFLIPNIKSIQYCIRTLHTREKGEQQK